MPSIVKCLDGPCEGREFFWDMNPFGGLREPGYEKRIVGDDGEAHVYEVDYGGATFLRTESGVPNA